MIDWAARAKAEFSKNPANPSDKTDESRVSSVSSVPSGRFCGNHAPLSPISAVLSVAPPGFSENHGVRAAPPTERKSGNPYMTPEQGDECHADGWNDAEIETFTARSARFIAMGRADAEHVAERLTLRDRQLDRRRMCLECDELETDGRCAAAHRGTLAGVDRRLEPVQNILMRCPAYISSKTYHR